MNLGIIFSCILIPSAISLVFSMIQKSKIKYNKRMTNKNFVVMNSNIIAVIGVLDAIASIIVLFGFTFFSEKLPHIIFYVVFGLFFWLGMYLIVETLCFKVIVKNKTIIVCKKFRKPFTFIFDDITFVIRKVSKNRYKTEKMKIKTKLGKIVRVDNNEICYYRFMNRIKEEVNAKFLHGFE